MRIRTETFALLSAIAAEDMPLTAADVSAALGMTGGSMRSRLARFVAHGWVRTTTVVEPRKGVTGRKDIAYFSITPAGRALLKARNAEGAHRLRRPREKAVRQQPQPTRIPNSVFVLASCM